MADKKYESKEKRRNIENNYIFSKEDINIGHQPEFDYLKTIDVFLIVISHVYLNYSEGFLVDIIRLISLILTAGGLMFLMGLGMKYSRHSEPKNFIDRGVVLLTLGQYVNLIRDTLPNLLAWRATGNKNFLARSMLVLQTDILTFAGITFIFMAFMKKMQLSDNFILIISIIMNFSSYPLFKIMKSPNSYLLSQFLGYFVLTDAEAYFPFCGYFIFVAFGNWLGGFYKKISNKDKFYNLILAFCLPIIAIYHYLRIHYNIPMLPEYGSIEHYSLSPDTDSIICCMSNLTAIAIFYKIDKLLKGKTPYFVIHAGKNLNQYYIVSYVLTMHIHIFLKATKGENFPSQFKFPTLFTFMILFISRILIDMNDKYIHFTITTLKNPIKNFIFSLIWITTIISVIYIYPKVEVYATSWNNYLN